MAQLTKNIGNQAPDYSYWYEGEIEYFVEDLKLRGIIIFGEQRGRRRDGTAIMEPAISFSGFWSQGDGLAFDCKISWPEFIETHPEFAMTLPAWWLLLSLNPDYFTAGTQRHNRSNTMSVEVCDNYPDVVEHGYFAGTEMESLPELRVHDLEDYIKGVCEAEAHKMYKSLEETYEAECEYIREQEIESVKENEAEQLGSTCKSCAPTSETQRASLTTSSSTGKPRQKTYSRITAVWKSVEKLIGFVKRRLSCH